MQRTRSSRALAAGLLLAVCGPIAAVGIAVAPPSGGVPQAKVIDRYNQLHGGKHHGVYRGPVGSIRHTSATTNA